MSSPLCSLLPPPKIRAVSGAEPCKVNRSRVAVPGVSDGLKPSCPRETKLSGKGKGQIPGLSHHAPTL